MLTAVLETTTQPTNGSQGWVTIVMMLVGFVAFYFFAIRPQK